jgi:O-methyltransferase involved in polyketide biosynthesis
VAVNLFAAISYDYGKFGRHSQTHALRALAFDNVACEYLRTHPRASVVALAEGLQTSFWRLHDAGVADHVTWYSLDLPPVVAHRHKLLPGDPRIVESPQSALDRSRMDHIDTAPGVLITAEGLRMYLAPADALGLIADCATVCRRPNGVRHDSALGEPAQPQGNETIRPLCSSTDAV